MRQNGKKQRLAITEVMKALHVSYYRAWVLVNSGALGEIQREGRCATVSAQVVKDYVAKRQRVSAVAAQEGISI